MTIPVQPRLLSTFGRLPGTWPAFLVILIAGLGEGVGIALFVPIIELMDGGRRGEASWFFRTMEEALRTVGVPVTVPALLALMVVLVCGSFALAYLQSRMLNQAQFRVIEDLRRHLFAGLFRARWAHLAVSNHGGVVNNLLVESLRYGQALTYEVRALATLILLAVYLVIGAALSVELLVVTALLGGSLALVVRPLLRRSKVLGAEANDANAAFSSHIVEVLRGAKLIKVTASEAAVVSRFAELNAWLRRIFFRSANNGELLNLVNRALPVLILALVIALAHGVFAIPTSLILVFLIVMSRIAPRISQLQQHYNQYVLRAPAIPVVDRMVTEADAAEEELRRGGIIVDALRDGIEFRDAGFRYPGADGPTLERIDLTIVARQIVAIVGSSGAGKSTLIDMIAGLRRPDSGAVLVDGADLADLDMLSWRRRIGYVTQEITVFNDTVRNNLLFAHPEAGEAAIRDALRIVRLDDLVAAMPDGLETLLGEGGVRLSGGQRQRLALARALIGDPTLLLLDEATSSLDNESERLIQKAIEEIAHRFTIVIVAHRLSTVRKADVIYVMERGRIVETGPYDRLLETGGRFTHLHQAQFL